MPPGLIRRLMDRAEELLLVALFVLMFVISFANVVARYFLRFALAFTEEMVLAAFVWATLLGTATVVRRGAQLAFTFLVDRGSRPTRRLALWLSSTATVVVFGALAYYGVQQVELERRLGFTTEALALPQWWYTAGVPAFAVWVVFRVLQAAWELDRTLRA
ncbi:MAG: TRAP transporter small permease [candidate division GAL15 bacterium]